MGRFRVSPEDLAKQKLVTPGWHPVEILKIVDGMDKGKNGPPAALTTVTARVFGGPEENVGAVLSTNFSEKAQGFVKNFVEAVGQKFEANKDYDISERTFKGKRMMWYVERGTYNGRATNNVVDYKPLEGDFAASTAAVAGAPAQSGGAAAQPPR